MYAAFPVAVRARLLPFAALVLLGSMPVAASAGYTVTEVGTLGPYDTVGYGLNNLGQVVGSSADVYGRPIAFLWDGKATKNIDPFPDFTHGSTALAINDQGLYVGFRTAFPPLLPIATLGGTQLFTGYNSSANAINNSGVAVGFYSHFDYTTPAQPFIATPNGADYAINPILNANGEAFDGQALAINDAGQVVGAADTGSGNAAFLWTPTTGGGPGTFTDLSTLLPSGSSSATSINASGQVVGTVDDGNGVTGFLYDHGNITALSFAAASINASGQVVGDTFLYSNGVTTDLSTLDLGHGFGPTQLVAINDSGQILARGFVIDEEGFARTRAYLLTPEAAVPEPAGLTLMALGGIGLLFAARKRRRADG